MKKKEELMRRLALYVFFNKNGIVLDYVTYYLDALKKIADKVVVVVNGQLSIVLLSVKGLPLT